MTARAETPKRPVDVALLSWTAGLTVFGWLVLYSASALLGDSRYGDQYFFLKRQMIWTALGMVEQHAAACPPCRQRLQAERHLAHLTHDTLALALNPSPARLAALRPPVPPPPPPH